MKELMVHVENAVRPTHASARRKHRMRQELLAHLTGIFEEERTHQADPEQALQTALDRFGEPEGLMRELQESVPVFERWASRLSEALSQESGASALRHALGLAALMAAAIVAEPVLISLARVAFGERWSAVGVAPASLGLVATYGFLAVLFGYGLCRALVRPVSRTSLLRATVMGAATFFTGVGLIAAGAVVQTDNALWEFILTSPTDPHALAASFWFTLLPVALACVAAWIIRARKARDRAWEDWAALLASS